MEEEHKMEFPKLYMVRKHFGEPIREKIEHDFMLRTCGNV